MKKELYNYLERYFEYWKKERGTFPMVPYDEDLSSELYFGEVDDDEYIQWRYMENNNDINFDSIEVKHGIKLRKEIKEFLSSYFFLQLEGFFNNKNIWITPIDESKDILQELDYIFTNESKELIPIGVYKETDMPLYYNNNNGNVVIYDWEKGIKNILTNSLEELFKQLSPKK